MTYTDEKNKPVSDKIVLVEISLPIVRDQFTNYSAGLWQIVLNHDLGKDGITITGSDGVVGFYEWIVSLSPENVNNIIVDSNEYTKQNTITDCIAQNESFYYDRETRQLIVHFNDFTVPWGHTVKIGIIYGFCNKSGRVNGATYQNIYYEPRVISLPSLSKRKDNLFTGILRYNQGQFVLDNIDGFFDEFVQQEIIGQNVDVKFGFDGLDYYDFEKVYSANILEYSYDFSKIQISVADNRRFMTRTVPSVKFTSEFYPYMEESNLGKVKPIAYGSIKKAPVICINEMQTAPASWQFYLCDVTDHAIASIDTVYLNGIAMAVTDWSYSAGIITIADNKFVSDDHDSYYIQDNLSEVTVTFVGSTGISKGLDVITDIMNIYGDIAYTATNYDTAEWAVALAVSREVGIYINTEIKVNEIIEKICLCEDGVFIIKDDGRITFRVFDETRTPVRTILTDEWMDKPRTSVKINELLSSVKIKFRKDLAGGGFLSYTNDLYDAYIYDRFKIRNEKTFETILVNSADAQSKAAAIMTKSRELIPLVTRKTKTQNIDLEIGDFIIAEHDRQSVTDKTWKIYELVEINKDLNTNVINLAMKYVKDY